MPVTITGSNRETLKRLISAALLVGYSYHIFYQGPVWLIFTTLLVQIKCFKEIKNVAYKRQSSAPGGIHPIAWYLLFTTNYFLYCENLAEHFGLFIRKMHLLDLLVRYHRFVAFCLYLSGLLWFAFKTIRRYGSRQFKFLAFVHVLLIVIVLQTYMVVDHIFSGIIWLLLTSVLVTLNDIYAFAFGRLCGRTPLIEVSPKKTWEGYIGAAVGTTISGMVVAHMFCTVDYLVCPIEYRETSTGIVMATNCTRSYIFTPQRYYFESYNSAVRFSVSTYPFVFHSLVMSLFASIVGPFGGFFASGFKRAFNVKHFGNTIPGHGGIMDRFDCFYLMVTFVNVYLNTFAKPQADKVDKIYNTMLKMSDEKQLQFFHLLQKSLENQLVPSDSTDIT